MSGNESVNLYADNADFVEQLYRQYLANPAHVSESWRTYFDALNAHDAEYLNSPDADEISRAMRQRAHHRAAAPAQAAAPAGSDMVRKQAAVLRLIHAYRLLGHHRAQVDPINLRGLPIIPDLDPSYHGLRESDYDLVFNTGNLAGYAEMKLRDIIEMLKETYTEHIGAEFMHIADVNEKRWLQTRLESTRTNPDYPNDFKLRLLERLTAAEGMEQFLHAKYSGQKRFSLEGGETLITALDEIIMRSGTQGMEEIVIGMAHRGRLNVLINIMGKSPQELFEEFEGKHRWKGEYTGDVKYHSGFSSDVQTPGGIVHLALGFNPSHLEIVNPVTCGSVRARQEQRHDEAREKVLGILIHGDAAFAGQGVVYETLNLAQTRGYGTGGTLHIVVNNRIGFTTSHPLDARSALYCTDVGKVIQAPIFHVNGDDPEAVAFIVQLAVNFRQAFKRDVVIDLVCYRRHGHNEADEPAATQPMMYKKIRNHPTTRKLYADKLEASGVIQPGEADRMAQEYRDALAAGKQVVPDIVTGQKNPYRINWSKFRGTNWTDPYQTAVPVARIRQLGAKLNELPEDFELHPRVAKIIDDRIKMASGALPIDWGFAENMAYATLVEEGYPVRISGQDSGRGTFFHRHSVLHNQRTGDEYIPLQHLSQNQANFRVIDSILSEAAVLGFEYGYSAATPNALVIWEAQFGDFANNAQVVIDQFIVAAEQKWGLLCGLVMMLPHGWEGQGPEHTSARLERFLQLAAQDNIQVCYPSTPEQMFHLLRRQMIRPYRKPLIIMTPKSMLRLKESFSTLEDLSNDRFDPVIGEVDPLKQSDVRRVCLCSGKVFYDLLDARRARKINDIAIVRMEQLYPFPAEDLARELNRYMRAREVYWVQEEPQNQGAWYSIQDTLRLVLLPGQTLSYAGRLPMAAPSGGDYHKHIERQKHLVDSALARKAGEETEILSARPQLIATTPAESTGGKT
ncbi:MAG: 2-oxoglutarate dehydrogenase E1 component [Kiritimatiellae bacterium]|nr:2-oxoglutarate dehydrogenase E1 component [Kiritimatiellia bacterium]